MPNRFCAVLSGPLLFVRCVAQECSCLPHVFLREFINDSEKNSDWGISELDNQCKYNKCACPLCVCFERYVRIVRIFAVCLSRRFSCSQDGCCPCSDKFTNHFGGRIKTTHTERKKPTKFTVKYLLSWFLYTWIFPTQKQQTNKKGTS